MTYSLIPLSSLPNPYNSSLLSSCQILSALPKSDMNPLTWHYTHYENSLSFRGIRGTLKSIKLNYHIYYLFLSLICIFVKTKFLKCISQKLNFSLGNKISLIVIYHLVFCTFMGIWYTVAARMFGFDNKMHLLASQFLIKTYLQADKPW